MSTCFNNRGSAGMLSLITMLVLGILGAAYITISSTETNISANYRDGIVAQYLAEAGANRAIAILFNNNGVWTQDIAATRLGTTGTYEVSVSSPSTTTREITSTGRVGSVNRRVVVRLTLGSVVESVFNYPIFSTGNMNIGNSDVYGTARSNGTINLNNGAYVSQDVIAKGDVNGKNNAVVGGKTLDHQQAITVPTYDKSKYSSATAINNVGKNETVNLSGDKYYRNGEFKIEGPKGKLVGNATIYVAGNVLIENGAEIGGNIFIIAEGDINIKQGATIDKGVLFSKQNINFEENSTFTGSAVAGGPDGVNGVININNNATITWSTEVVTHFGLGGGNGQMTINSWGNQ